MSNEVLRLLIELRAAALVAIGVTLAAYLALLLCIKRLKIEGRGTRLAGLFVGLGGRSLLHLSTAWIKLTYFTAVLLLSQPARPGHYYLLAACTAVSFVLSFRLGALTVELLSGSLMAAGLWVSSTLLNYLRQIRYDRNIQIAYWMLAAFLILCAVAVFLREIIFISSERAYFDENGEIE